MKWNYIEVIVDVSWQYFPVTLFHFLEDVHCNQNKYMTIDWKLQESETLF